MSNQHKYAGQACAGAAGCELFGRVARSPPRRRRVAGDGVIVSHGGMITGYGLYLKDGVPRFITRSKRASSEFSAKIPLPLHRATHVAGVLNGNGELVLLINGAPVAKAEGLYLEANPIEPMSIGRDAGPTYVAQHHGALPFRGSLADLRIHWGVPDAGELESWSRAD